MRKIVLTFGLISGAIMAAMMLLTMPFIDTIGFDKGLIVGYSSMILAFLLIYFGIRSYRDNVGHGTISFGRAFSVGILISLISSICYVATWEVVYFNFMPDFADKYNAQVLKEEKAKGASPQQLEIKRVEGEKFKQMYKNPFYNVAMTFVEPFPVGVVITLVAAGVLSWKRKPQLATT